MTDILTGTAFLLLLIGGSVLPAAALSARWVGRVDPFLHALTVATLAAFHLTLLFHGLLALAALDRTIAGGALLAGIALVFVAGDRSRPWLGGLTRFGVWTRRMLRSARRSPASLLYGFAAILAVITVARALMLPAVGWDTLTYHFVKAGMWVQSGEAIRLVAPGGWGLYLGIFGGGELFTAWAMLPFGNDMLAPAVDLLWWALLACALYALGRELGLRVRHRLAVVLYASFLPAIWDAVGWGYVDLANLAFSLTGLVFATRHARTREPIWIALALMALALAAGIKLNSAPFFALAAGVLLVQALGSAPERGRSLAVFVLGGAFALVTVGPWVLANWLETGYPLRMPIRIAGIDFGPPNIASAWYREGKPEAFVWVSEWAALRGVFQPPWTFASHASLLSLVPLALAPVGFVRAFRARVPLRPALVLLAGFVGLAILLFYSPNFSPVRLGLPWTNGRFVMPVVLPCLVLAFAAIPSQSRGRDVLAGYLLVGCAVHLAFFGYARIALPSPILIGGGAVALVLGLVLVVFLSRARPGAGWLVAPLLVLSMLFGLDALRSPERRYELLANRYVPADIFRYWWVAARMLDEESGSHRVAVTSGPWQDADNWLAYYLMGRDLQSTLHYVPITTDGTLVPFGPDSPRPEQADFDAWLGRVRAEEISHVMAFVPPSIELGWMDARPDLFERITGFEDRWALFRFNPAAQRSGDVASPDRKPPR